MDFFNRKIISTEDGSSTVFLSELNQHYHSIHGAMQESLHVFMKMGWNVVAESERQIDILEIGFGTGLNALLVLEECLRDDSKIVSYTSLENYPLAIEEVKQLNYVQNDLKKELFLRLHESVWNEEVKIVDNFSLNKIRVRLEDFIPVVNKYNLIFFDAFAPDFQPELWTEEIFRKLFLSMKCGGILVTYCAKGQVRRNMIAAGFTVERLEGPPGKREMLRGIKN
jgi:tRNA U34 5-methylaminomethyl-2-thiouridine-forming methyltransferase MnmC